MLWGEWTFWKGEYKKILNIEPCLYAHIAVCHNKSPSCPQHTQMPHSLSLWIKSLRVNETDPHLSFLIWIDAGTLQDVFVSVFLLRKTESKLIDSICAPMLITTENDQ